MPLAIVAVLLLALGITATGRAHRAAGDLFAGESPDTPINSASPIEENATPNASFLSLLQSSLGTRIPAPSQSQVSTTPTVQDTVTQQNDQETKPVFNASEPIEALCQVDARNHPGYTVICNGKRYN